MHTPAVVGVCMDFIEGWGRMGRNLAARVALITTATVAGEGVFSACVMAGISDMALPITRFVSVEVVESLLSAARQRTVVTLTGVIAVVHVAEEAAPAVEPGTSSNEDSAGEPVGPVVAVGRAFVGFVVEVPIGANGGHANFDGDLGRPGGCGAEQGSCKC